MSKFTPMKPADVQVGRGRAAAEARQPYVAALKEGDAGKVELERGEKPGSVKRLLQDAAKESGIRIRSSWEDRSQRTLLWKRVGK